MNFGYANLRTNLLNPSQIEGTLIPGEVSEVLCKSLNKPIKESLDVGHPLERVERLRRTSEFQMNMNMLRNIQGIHAPMRISMELKAFDNVGRLPFMSSSNLGKDILVGRDEFIDFDDILYPSEVHEKMMRPYAVMDRKLTVL